MNGGKLGVHKDPRGIGGEWQKHGVRDSEEMVANVQIRGVDYDKKK